MEELVGSPIIAIGSSLILAVLYVASLYVWNSKDDRDHPSTIKKRFASVTVVMLISPFITKFFLVNEVLKDASLWRILGFRSDGLFNACCMAIILTSILFLGPITMNIKNGLWQMYGEVEYWKTCFTNMLWLRNHLMAPLSEELVFRACMLPLLLQAFKPITSVLVGPLFFGVGHVHHIYERIRSGMQLSHAILITFFQFMYTTIFGIYSAYLFMRTGHFAAPFLAHVFCNHMGFPDMEEIFAFPMKQRICFLIIYLVGLVSWIVLLIILTEPSWYENNQFWININSSQ